MKRTKDRVVARAVGFVVAGSPAVPAAMMRRHTPAELFGMPFGPFERP